MFRGSPGLSADQLANIGSIMGGNFNANTRENLTQYLFTVPSEDLDLALHIESIRMRDVNDSDADWNNERGAIEQEVAQDLSNPDYVMFEKLRQIMFAGTPYEHDALGTRPSFDKTTGAMLKAFTANGTRRITPSWWWSAISIRRRRWRRSGNILARFRAKRCPRMPQSIPKPITPSEPVAVPTDQANGSSMLAMRMPGLDSPDFPALEVLSDVLNSERSDLYALVPQGKALGDRLFARSARQSRHGLCLHLLSRGRRCEGRDGRTEKRRCRRFCRTASRPIWWMPPRRRKSARRNSRRTPSPVWPLSGPKRWRCIT